MLVDAVAVQSAVHQLLTGALNYAAFCAWLADAEGATPSIDQVLDAIAADCEDYDDQAITALDLDAELSLVLETIGTLALDA